ncbi:Crp/Fnr family transcriptional regulator [Aestuariicoccus sp. MJ-SS9]|uniref:Crp/Fnr family transcriptional regulator n=1 Tax=Aestuariicoccus sp. MJ-SS9 TaxID=3079855 RepID=UPI0029075AAB|nr:Crp/Fnr family transcriptional regulator [Aestuariicoccus sp. MJ-SS9]MDU8909827.1 Crp/Fnr family transcriptional regulator [Aestuariicoccus sp. MJ-SS9]
MATQCRNCPIRKLDLFTQMRSEEVEFMERFKVGEMTVDAGAPLMSEGANTPQLFTALSGMGLRYKLLANGRRQVINFVFPGDFLGLQAGVMNEMTHSVEATTPMRLCVFDRSELWTLFKSRPERAFDLTWLAALEERFLGETVTSVGQKSAIERVAWAFSRIYRRICALGLDRDGEIPLPYRQQDLADALGLSLVHTNKTLARLRDRQLASWSDGRLRVPDIEALEEAGLVDTSLVPRRPLM